MSLIDDIRRDREAGTPGPWWLAGRGTIRRGRGVWIAKLFWSAADADGRRIARVPQIEEIALAAEAMAEALRAYLPIIQAMEGAGHWDDYAHGTGIATANKYRAALAAYRKATEGGE